MTITMSSTTHTESVTMSGRLTLSSSEFVLSVIPSLVFNLTLALLYHVGYRVSSED